MKQTVCSRLRSDAQGKTLYLLSWLAYASAYIGRYNYSAVMGAITAENSLSLSAAGAVSTGYFICYAVGQIVFGLLSQSFSPYAMILLGLCGSGLCNLGAGAFSTSFMGLLWGANGLFQAMIWPPIVRLFAESMPLERQKRTCVSINSTTPAGTLAAYALSAVLLLAVTTASMLGVNTMFINVIPVKSGRHGGASMLSGTLNAVTYLGAAAATWGIGAAAEGCGWNAVFLLWLGMAMFALLVSTLLAGRWGRYLKSSEGGVS